MEDFVFTNFNYSVINMPKLISYIDHPKIVHVLNTLYTRFNKNRKLSIENKTDEWRNDFRFHKAYLIDMLTIEKPWFKYPVCMLTKEGSLDDYRAMVGTEDENYYKHRRENLDELDNLYSRAIRGKINILECGLFHIIVLLLMVLFYTIL